MTGIDHVPPRAWTLAKLAASHGWDVRVEPNWTCCDVTFSRGNELLSIGWWTNDGKARLGHVSYGSVNIRLRDVPTILREVRRG